MRAWFGDVKRLGQSCSETLRPFAGGAYMPLFGMCAISERPAGAGPSTTGNGLSRWLLNGVRG